MTTVAEALEAWYLACANASCPDRVETLLLPLSKAVGRVTARTVWAPRSSPPFDASAMDGIAVRASDTTGARDCAPLLIPEGAFEVIDTGDPLPDPFDAVVMREHIRFTNEGAELRAEVARYQNVRSIGEDIVANELLLFEGHRLRPVDVAACGAAGVTEVLVRRRPIVAVLPTGDEIRPIGADIAPGQFYDTNSLMLAALAEEIGCEATVLPIEPDDPDGIGHAALKAAATCDLLIIIAGASAGRDDYTVEVIKHLGVLAVHGVAVRPGHPVVLGAIDSTPVLGAPGYPVSAALSFEIFAAPLIARLEGTLERARPAVRARLARKIASPGDLDEWVRVRLGRVGGRLLATALPRGAGVLTSLVRADGLLLIPAGAEGRAADAEVDVRLLRETGEIENTIVVMGSDDVALDLAASSLRSGNARLTLAVTHVGSLGGLAALRDGLCHLAGSHLLDPETGDYTLSWLDQVLPGRDIAVVRLAVREQGLIVAPGNPLGLSGIEDLARGGLRYVNRQPGSGTRALLDYELARSGIAPASILGDDREEHTNLAVAAAVAAGRFDCGLGVLAAARAFGLDFVRVRSEPFDLVLNAASLEDPLLGPFWDLLSSDSFQASVRALGGYDTSETGKRIL
jgi:putative molybdopterin biosynthesis protein